MKKTTAILISSLAAFIIIVTWVGRGYNQITIEAENTARAWADVEANYQRRADLLPNLVEAAKAAGAREAKTFTQVAEARANATNIKIDAENITEQNLQAFQKAQGQVAGALSRLIAMKESYPQLKSNEAFLKLQREIAVTENRIAASRYTFGEQARDYNTKIREVPNNIVAMITGYKAKPYFKADEGAQFATKVDFGYDKKAENAEE
ncbi:MAG: LemA family protein [Paludibacteraceae bacterium]|nr:LemA family protein [Paludibacteraceae bacterium]